MLAPLGGVTAKRMFGGHGFFREGLMFGLVADGVFFLKADAENAGEFDALDLPPFTYTKATGEVYAMSYRQCPEDALENSAAMTRWAESAFAAAQRNAKPKKSKKPNRKLP
ncbi:MAG: TfoX/Sxy family protein [Verrucomicrobiae bacterium]|nr:TfoX/Sxy family protein [Verrucomicrobiae bacterium]MCP5539449.1 TfoX/Sxy family protein [Akkermansiaceae bacterium]